MNKYNYFCTGCGLCKSVYPNEVEVTEGKYRSFIPKSDQAIELCEQVCLCCDNTLNYSSDLFGAFTNIYYTHSNNQAIRSKGSSGGTLTTIAIYLISNHIVDGIIQVENNGAYGLKLAIHDNPEQIIASSGSRYIDSNNLENLLTLIDFNKKYCFIGKPCDVSTLRRYSKISPEIENSIILYLSFFCAGSPSVEANRRLVESLGCKGDDCKDISYRGNGWPGKTIVSDCFNRSYETTYENTWMNYLGRDTRTICRFCIDGIGELADISCGDAWYLNNGQPDFSEREGRNVTFARSERGDHLLKSIISSGELVSGSIDDPQNYLKQSNPYQYIRRSTLEYTLLAMKITNKPYPNYNKKVLHGCSAKLPMKTRLHRLLGTIKRIILRKI